MATPLTLGHSFLLTLYLWKALPALRRGLSVLPPPATTPVPRFDLRGDCVECELGFDRRIAFEKREEEAKQSKAKQSKELTDLGAHTRTDGLLSSGGKTDA